MSAPNAAHRTHQKVWRDSFVAGEYESEVFRPYDRDEMAISLEAAERYDRDLKMKGERNGPIGHVGLEVYRALWRRVNFRSGRCDPSIDGLMKATGRSRRAVVAALKRLWNCGLIRWIRRFVYTGGRGIRGPQVAQATNAYELRYLPASMLARLPPAKRARYRPRMRPATPPRPKGKKSTFERLGAAWGRMDETIRAHLTRQWLTRKSVRDSWVVEVVEERESTQTDQTMPLGV